MPSSPLSAAGSAAAPPLGDEDGEVGLAPLSVSAPAPAPAPAPASAPAPAPAPAPTSTLTRCGDTGASSCLAADSPFPPGDAKDFVPAGGVVDGARGLGVVRRGDRRDRLDTIPDPDIMLALSSSSKVAMNFSRDWGPFPVTAALCSTRAACNCVTASHSTTTTSRKAACSDNRDPVPGRWKPSWSTDSALLAPPVHTSSPNQPGTKRYTYRSPRTATKAGWGERNLARRNDTRSRPDVQMICAMVRADTRRTSFRDRRPGMTAEMTPTRACVHMAQNVMHRDVRDMTCKAAQQRVRRTAPTQAK